MASTHVIHDAASKGFHNALSYDAHRPSYGDAAVSSLLKHLGLEGKAQSRIVDLGAGTGKFTEVLAARPEEFEIIAVEPLDSMRETLAEKQLKGVEARAGTASDMETVETGWADGCIVAQVSYCPMACNEMHCNPEARFWVQFPVELWHGVLTCSQAFHW